MSTTRRGRQFDITMTPFPLYSRLASIILSNGSSWNLGDMPKTWHGSHLPILLPFIGIHGTLIMSRDRRSGDFCLASKGGMSPMAFSFSVFFWIASVGISPYLFLMVVSNQNGSKRQFRRGTTTSGFTDSWRGSTVAENVLGSTDPLQKSMSCMPTLQRSY